MLTAYSEICCATLARKAIVRDILKISAALCLLRTPNACDSRALEKLEGFSVGRPADQATQPPHP